MVKERLGGGSSAIALLVDQGGRELILKIARRPDYSERILAEHATLDACANHPLSRPRRRRSTSVAWAAS